MSTNGNNSIVIGRTMKNVKTPIPKDASIAKPTLNSQSIIELNSCSKPSRSKRLFILDAIKNVTSPKSIGKSSNIPINMQVVYPLEVSPSVLLQFNVHEIPGLGS